MPEDALRPSIVVAELELRSAIYRERELESAMEARAQCLGLMEKVAETDRDIVITKRGWTVARLAPIRLRLGALIGLYRHQIRIDINIVLSV